MSDVWFRYGLARPPSGLRDERVYRALWRPIDHGPNLYMSAAGFEAFVRDRVQGGLERGAIDVSDILSAYRCAGVTLHLRQVKCAECCPPLDFSGTLFGI